MIVKTPRPRIGPKSQALASKRLTRLLIDLYDEPMPLEARQVIPEAWATLEDDIDCEEPKVKVTLRMDASVAKFYRAMGRGYQARMNRVLATYAQMQIARVTWFEGERDDAVRQAGMEAIGMDRGGNDAPDPG
ncbi:MAG: BrnA antitoxin family protein [Pseudomonadota bacterium]